MDLYDKFSGLQSVGCVSIFICRDIKGRWGIRFYRNFPNPYAIDITEIDGFDNFTPCGRDHSGVHGPGGKDVRGRPELLSGQWK